jgi:hypothetical protein
MSKPLWGLLWTMKTLAFTLQGYWMHMQYVLWPRSFNQHTNVLLGVQNPLEGYSPK